MLDIVIKNGRIVDGTAGPWRRGDIGIKDGKIAEIGKIPEEEGAEVIDAKDHYVTPGFIDIHSHSDWNIRDYPLDESRIAQGITTEIGGNCGISDVPGENEDGILADLSREGVSVNFGTLTGHGSVRTAVMGMSNQKPDSRQLDRMYCMVRDSLQEGSFGLSSGLIYPPGCYSDREEMIALLKAVRDEGGFYATHMRDESRYLVEAVKEALEVAEEAQVTLEISHHKCTCKDLWGKAVYETTAMIEEARERGMDVTCDQYPYRASATGVGTSLPDWAFEGGFDKMTERFHDPAVRQKIAEECEASHAGRWGDIYVSSIGSEKNSWMIGKSMEELSEITGKSASEVTMDIVEDENNHAGVIRFSMDENDIEYIMARPYVMTGSDGGAMPLEGEGTPHPRNFGTFTRVLAYYCRERKLFTLEEAIHKMTSMPAAKIGLTDRGLLRPGMWADIVIFDFDNLESCPTYDEPRQASRGIDWVLVNGVITARDGKHLGAKAGQLLKRR